MRYVLIMIGVITALYGLEWQKMPGIPLGRADDIAIGYTYPENEQKIYIADQFSWPYKWNSDLNQWDSIGYNPPAAYNPVAIVCDPNNAKNLWIARSSDYPNPGVFYSSDEGGNWSPRNDGITNFNILTLNMAPDNPNVLFLGCELDLNQPEIFKTTNGGQNWFPVGDLNTTIYNIETPSYSSNYIYAATQNGVYESPDGGNSWSITLNKRCFDLKISGNYIYALCQYGGEYILYRKSHSTTALWKIVGSFPYPQDFKPGKGKIEIDMNSNIYLALQWLGLYKSTDNGNTWEEILKSKIKIDPLLTTVVVDPRNPDIIYVGAEFHIYRSLDGGNTWKIVTKGMRNNNKLSKHD